MVSNRSGPRAQALSGWHRVAFRAGEIAAAAGLAAETNPHDRGSSEALIWLAGWRASAPRPVGRRGGAKR
ncbi:MAG: hypothetical protein GC191_03585 [Azospirillum sp.]|nr:hypothetical protein [Azospirillum sp.]